jgi:hypothetical protein
MSAGAVGLSLEQTRLYARQLALPEIGIDGQLRLAGAAVALVGGGSASAAAAEHLRAAGVERVDARTPAASAAGWRELLADVQAVARFSLDDDALLRACVRAGVPVVFGRERQQGVGVDLLSFRRHGPCPHQELAVPVRTASDAPTSAAGPLLGTLVASELIWILIAPQAGPRARLLRLPLDGAPPEAAEIPWAPECFLCGGRGQVAVFAGGGA